MNMSYCRFQNTATDLRDCARFLEELFSADQDTGNDELSRDEELAAIILVDQANDIIQMVRENLGLRDDEELRSEKIAEYISSENALAKAARIAREERQRLEDDEIPRPSDPKPRDPESETIHGE